MDIINRFFAPKRPATNTDTNLLKLIAMITMFIDHAGKMLFSNYAVFRMVGRMAFPIYAYCLAVGAIYTKHPMKYVSRMALLAMISQPLYALGLNHLNSSMYTISVREYPVRAIVNFYLKCWYKPSILVALTCGLILLLMLKHRQYILALGMLLFCYLAQGQLDYGIKGIVLMLLFYLTCEHPLISVPLVASFMIWWATSGGGYTLFGQQFTPQMFAVVSLPLIYIPTNSGVKLPKWLFYAFYPAHLALLWYLTAGL